MQSTALAKPAPKPFLPTDIDGSKLLVRAALAHSVAAVRGEYPDEIARRYWPKDLATHALVTRSASSVATTTGSGWADTLAAQSTGAFIGSLLPSAGAALINAGARFDMGRNAKINLPYSTTTGVPHWVGEGQPIPVGQATIAKATLSLYKLALIETLTREVAEHSAQDGETTVGMILRDAARNALDAALFGNAAGVAGVSPPGLLNGVAATTASTAGAGYTAALSDTRLLIDAITAAGAGRDVRFFASPGRATVAKSYMPDIQVYGSAAIPAAQWIAIDVASFASGFGADPQITASMEAVLHYEDTAPAGIGTVGTPNVVAAPARSMFQTDVIALRMILRASWVMRAPAIAFINTGLTW